MSARSGTVFLPGVPAPRQQPTTPVLAPRSASRCPTRATARRRNAVFSSW
jgi:hypothetical protein